MADYVSENLITVAFISNTVVKHQNNSMRNTITMSIFNFFFYHAGVTALFLLFVVFKEM